MTKRVKTKAAQVRKLLCLDPNTNVDALVKKFNMKRQNAYVLLSTQRKALGLIRNRDGTYKFKERMQSSDLAIAGSLNKVPSIVETHFPITMEEPQADPVNHPPHYKVGGIETIDFIEAKKLGYHLGNVVKYITRADHKGAKVQDLQKAQWYLTRAIELAK